MPRTPDQRFPPMPSPYCVHWRGLHAARCALGIQLRMVTYWRRDTLRRTMCCDRLNPAPFECLFALWEDEIAPPAQKAKWED